MVQRSLDDLVIRVASRLMAADAQSAITATESVLELLVGYFDVDFSYLRHTDQEIRATVLIAEWPPRTAVPSPDPLGVVYFAEADSVFKEIEHAVEPLIVRPEMSTADYQERVEMASGIPQISMAAVPLVSGNVPTGLLGLVKTGDRAWSPDEINALKAIAALFAQVQGRVLAEERLRHSATHDDLTGLSNRRALLENLTGRLADGAPGPVSVLYLDVDRLKALNDFLGHTAGDAFIYRLARRLRDQTDPRDMIARLGGDEFVIVPALPMNARGAQMEAQRIQRLITERVMLGGESVSRGVSIGASVGEPGATSVTDILRQADQAVLAAKAAGGNGIAIFTDEMRSQSELRDDVELHLRHAVDDDSLRLHYQPEVDMRNGRIEAIEALVRWEHPTRGLLQPSTFIGVAEATNLAGELGRWVIRSACEQLSEWRREGLAESVLLRINVSPVQLVSLDFVRSVAEILTEFSLTGEFICLEVTEHVVVQDLTRTQVTLKGLKELGVRIAIDDFGTGYSSLSHLKALPVDLLKIDRGFVQGLGSDADDLAIVRSITGLAEAFGLNVVAEGVETVAAARTLLELGCTNAQGFLISKPVTASETAALLRKGTIDIFV